MSPLHQTLSGALTGAIGLLICIGPVGSRAMTTNGDAPAYPHESYDADADMDTVKPGLTKREAFAMAALTGLCSTALNPPVANAVEGIHRRAELAVEMADALLSELSKPRNTK